MPENLTTWRIKVWGMGNGTRVGQGFTDVVTRKDLIIRMEAPRFFVQTDEVVLSAIVHNYLKTQENVKVRWNLTVALLDVSIGQAPMPTVTAWRRLAGAIAQIVKCRPTARPASIGGSRCSTRARPRSA